MIKDVCVMADGDPILWLPVDRNWSASVSRLGIRISMVFNS